MSSLSHYARLLAWGYLTLASASPTSFISDIKSLGIDVVTPGDSGYSPASTAFNLRYTFQPAAVAFPLTIAQVSSILPVAVQYDYQVVARSGGHSYVANGLGGKNGVVVIDMQSFNTISIDNSKDTATIGSGTRLGDLALALNQYGRALPHGTCPYVGVGGHSGFGGFGFSSRKWGLLLDTIQTLAVVLANGTIATASATENPDLFWAFRGSSPSFGIVVSLVVKTFAAPASTTVFEYEWTLSAIDAANAIDSFQSFAKTNLPAEFSAQYVFAKGPRKGQVWMSMTGAFYDSADKFNSTIAPLLNKINPKPTNAKVTPGSYIDSVIYFGGLGRLNTTISPDSHDTFYAKSLMTPEDSAITSGGRQAFTTFLANEGFNANTDWFVEMGLYGGTNSAINSVPFEDTAFSHRNSMFTFQFYTSSRGNVPPFPTDGFTLLDGMANSIINNSPPGWNYGAYPNYLDDRLQNWQQLYYGTHYAKLQRLKAVYDPQSIFTFPTSITI